MKIPNVDGQYETKNGRVKVTVSRRFIELDIGRGSSVHIIDESPRSGQTADKMDNVMNVINKTSKILMG